MAVFRLGLTLPTPGISTSRPSSVHRPASNARAAASLGLVNLFTGGALLQLTVFALGIMPYITASIILQLLTVVIPRFEPLKKEGQAGQAKITQYTRYLTIALAILQATGIVAAAPGPARCSAARLRPSRSIPNHVRSSPSPRWSSP